MESFPNRRAAPIYVLFVVSGLCALVYETLWLRLCSLYCGNTTFAAASILTAFMAGLALGSYLIGRYVDTSPHPLRVYALMELLIGIYAWLLPHLLQQLKWAFALLTNGLQNHFFPLNLGRFLIVFILLILPTSMMGGTLPALVKALGGERGRTARRLAYLYALNTLGGVLGTAIAGFYSIGTIGLARTQQWAVFLNLLVAGAAYVFSRVGDYASIGIPSTSLEAPDRPPESFLLVCFGLAGFAALAYEVVCLRLLLFLLPYGYNNVYVFCTVLATFLFGIAAGSAFVGRWIDDLRNPLRTLAIIQMILGFLTAASLPVLSLLLRLDSAKEIPDFSTRALYSFAFCFLVLIPPTALMGAALPIYGRLGMANYARLGTDIGKIYSANTLGNIAGAFLGGFLLIPLIGIQKSFALISLVYLLVGVVMAGATERARKSHVNRTYIMAIGAAVVMLLVWPFQRLIRPEPPYKLIHYSEGISSTILVLEDGSTRSLQINDFVAAGTGYETLRNQRMMAYLPLLLHADPKNVLVVCLGTGTTAGAFAICPFIDKVTVVEIDEQVPQALGMFGQANFHLDRSPRNTRIVVEDGRAFLEFDRGSYDIITGEPLHPKRAGTVNLYTREYYEDGLRHLRPGGIFAQWIPVHALSLDELRAIMRSFAEVFPHHYLWMGEQLIMLGCRDALRPQYEQIASRISLPQVSDGLRQVDFDDPVSILSGFLLWDESFRAFSISGKTLRDDLPLIEFSRDIRDHNLLRPLFARRGNFLPFVHGLDPTDPSVHAAFDAHTKADMATADLLDGNDEQALSGFQDSLILNPSDRRVQRWARLVKVLVEQKRPGSKFKVQGSKLDTISHDDPSSNFEP